MSKKLFTDPEEGVIKYGRNCISVEPEHYSTYEKRVDEKVNQGIAPILELLPDLIKYIDEDTQKQIERETEPHEIGYSLAELYPNDVIELIRGLIWGEIKKNESIDRLEYTKYRDYRQELEGQLHRIEDEISSIILIQEYKHHK